MPRNITSLSVFLASPSDVQAERELVASTIQQWNTINGHQRDVMFDLRRWETSVSAGFGTDGQQVINTQIDDDYDVLIALFWSKLGTETPRSRSGTVEEYERALARFIRQERVEIAFFFKDQPIDFRFVDLGQLDALKKFETEVHTAGALSKSYKDNEGLRFEINLLLDRLARGTAPTSVRRDVGLQLENTNNALSQDEDDCGLFDVVENMESSAESASSFLTNMTAGLGSLTAKTKTAAEELAAITKVRAITAAEAKPIIENVAVEMDGFSVFLETDSAIFDEDVSMTVGYIRSLIDISYDFIDGGEESLHNTAQLQQGIVALYGIMGEAEESLNDLLVTTSGLQRTTSVFNKSKKRLVRNLESLTMSMKNNRALLMQAIQELSMLIATASSKGQTTFPQ